MSKIGHTEKIHSLNTPTWNNIGSCVDQADSILKVLKI
jgi:hypothetical protein